jgi:hypothetical protein
MTKLRNILVINCADITDFGFTGQNVDGRLVLESSYVEKGGIFLCNENKKF